MWTIIVVQGIALVVVAYLALAGRQTLRNTAARRDALADQVAELSARLDDAERIVSRLEISNGRMITESVLADHRIAILERQVAALSKRDYRSGTASAPRPSTPMS